MTSNFNKLLLQEINLARTKPKQYAEKILSYQQYFKGNILRLPEELPIITTEGFKAFLEAANHLKNLEPLQALQSNTYLNNIAEDSIKEVQKYTDADQVNSLPIETYIEKYGQVAGIFSQAFDFGSVSAELAVINLLVDDGDLNRGNRSNLLHSKFRYVGISNSPHKTYHHCAVVIFVRHFIPEGESPGELSEENYQEVGPEEYIKQDSKPKKEEGKFIMVSDQPAPDQDFDLPDGIAKIERQERIVTENGRRKKIIKLTKYRTDDTVEVEVYKEPIA